MSVAPRRSGTRPDRSRRTRKAHGRSTGGRRQSASSARSSSGSRSSGGGRASTGHRRESQPGRDRPRRSEPSSHQRTSRGTDKRGAAAGQRAPRDPLIDEIRAATPKAKQEAAIADIRARARPAAARSRRRRCGRRRRREAARPALGGRAGALRSRPLPFRPVPRRAARAPGVPPHDGAARPEPSDRGLVPRTRHAGQGRSRCGGGRSVAHARRAPGRGRHRGRVRPRGIRAATTRRSGCSAASPGAETRPIPGSSASGTWPATCSSERAVPRRRPKSFARSFDTTPVRSTRPNGSRR